MIYLLIGYMWLFIHRPFEVWPVLGTFRIERVYIILCILYWALLYPRKTWPANRLNTAFIVFWAVFLLAYLVSPFQGSDRCYQTLEDYFKLVVFYVLVVSTVRDEKQLKIVSLAYLVVVGLYMTHSLREFHNGRFMYRMGIARMIGVDQTFKDPNGFAATILYSLPLTLAFWPEATSRKHRLLLLYYTGLTVLCVVLTGSRSGMVVMGCYFLLCFRRLLRKKLLLLFFIAAIPLGWVVMPPDLQNRFWTLIDPSVGPKSAQQSAEGRLQGLWDGIYLWGQNPVLGVGPGAHGPAMGTGVQPHSLYGQVCGETGTCGVLAFLGILAGFARNGWEMRRLRRHDESDRGRFLANLSNAILISVTLLLVKGFGDHNLYRYTWLWLGAFQVIAVQCMRQLATAPPDPAGETSGGPDVPMGWVAVSPPRAIP
jgi:O-antigen ligase